MTHPANDIPTLSSINVAVHALAGQGQYGVVSAVARDNGLSRQQVYDLRNAGLAALQSAFGNSEEPEGWTLTVTEADIARTVIALRVVTPASIRDEVAMLPIIYGTGWSYGKVQGVLVEAAGRADVILSAADLSGIANVALDEMFSQGRPVLGGIDLDSGYLFALEEAPTRKGAEWAELLGSMRDEQHLRPTVVTKDAGSGLAKGVSMAWPSAEQRDDHFHAVYAAGKVAHKLERSAYGAIARVEELKGKRRAAQSKKRRRSLGQKLRGAQQRMELSITKYDAFEVERRQLDTILRMCPRGCGRLRAQAEVEAELTAIAARMVAIGGDHVEQVGKYIANRARGLASYLGALADRLACATPDAGGARAVEAVTRAYQASIDEARGGPAWDAGARRLELDEAVRALLSAAPGPSELKAAVEHVLPHLQARHRASSAIECLNSVLRPYLVVQKHAEQDFLSLFRFYWNTRIREWGRHKGTSAWEALHGERVDDWLTLLGYPPSANRAAA